MTALRESSVEQIADLLADTKSSEPKTCLLIGAGVSYTAGIGLANDFIAKIERDFPSIYKAACEACKPDEAPTYAQCMAQLPPAMQVKLVRTDIDAARTNWAHIGIARLERASVVDTILTPNFDPLASRACALFNRFPAIYDLAGLRDETDNHISFDKSFVKGSAIFHLHGQHTGFLLLNTAEKLQSQAKRIRPVLDAVMKGKPVIIAGYSGENDPLIDQIAELAPFNHGLFWICRDDTDPADNVVQKLLSLENCYVVRNMPSDRFFTDLANSLELEPPGFLATPFDHMLNVLDTLRPYSDLQKHEAGKDLLEQARQQLTEAAFSQSEQRPESANIAKLMSSGQFEKVWKQYADRHDTLNESDKTLVAWAAIELGNRLWQMATEATDEKADALFLESQAKYETALSINAEMPEAFNNWGNTLSDQAKKKTGKESDELFEASFEKYSEALRLDPEKSDTFNNWGYALAEQAKMKEGVSADKLFEEAYLKFSKALEINPEFHQAYKGWGDALTDQAESCDGEIADQLFAEGFAKYASALEIKPNEGGVLNNWGAALLAQSKTKNDDEAAALVDEAFQKFTLSSASGPERFESLTNMANAFLIRAGGQETPLAKAYLNAAIDKYSRAQTIKPDRVRLLSSWATAITRLARLVGEDEAEALYNDASAKYAKVIEIDPTDHKTLTNWGTALVQQAMIKEGELSISLLQEGLEKYRSALEITPNDPAVIRALADGLAELAVKTENPDSASIFTEADNNYAKAAAILSKDTDVLNNWSSMLLKQAARSDEDTASALMEKAKGILETGETIRTGSCAYNLACCHARRGEAEEASQWLRKARKLDSDFPDCNHIKTDVDFDEIRGSPEFENALQDIGCA